MAASSQWVFTNGTVPPTPTAGTVALYNDSADNRFKRLASDGQVKSVVDNILNCRIAAITPTANTDTIITNGTSSWQGSANELTAGSEILVRIAGTSTTTAAGSQVFTVRYGTAGTTADTAIATCTVVAATSGTAIPFYIELMLTVRTVGSSGTLYGIGNITNQGTTGFYTLSGGITIMAGSLVMNTTTTGYINVSYNSGNASTAATFQQVIIKVLKQ
jgi:hypothetical protein